MSRVNHLAGTYDHRVHKYFSFCGMYVVYVTLFREEVTCKRCLKALKKERRK